MTENLPQAQNLTKAELFDVLKNSLYVGAQDESIKLVLGYCQAAGLDPMQKPVHIVPMYCATGKKDAKGYDVKAMRDVIMPGIGMYRIQASRSGEYAGASEPIYGKEIVATLGGASVSYPQFCKITVSRILKDGSIAKFSSIEYWRENYATKNKDTQEPNAMWKKRPYGQIAKCAEAQALRKAFPEFGSEPTVDEMEGKEINVTQQQNTEDKREPKELDLYSDDDFSKNIPAWKKLVTSGKKSADDLISFVGTKAILTEDQIIAIKEWENNIEDA